MIVRFLRRILFFSVLLCNHSYAQTILPGSFADETARSLQLMGKVDSTLSFNVRPFQASGRLLSERGLYKTIDSSSDYLQPHRFKKAALTILPLTIVQQFNSHHPFGWNDGAMIAAKSYQAMVRAGIHISAGPLDVQLQPEFVYAANPGFEHNSQYGNILTGAYKKIFPGQSSISISAGAFSAGVSTENLWWGPGMRSALLMSNNAPGFNHFFFKSRRPVKTGIGSFEWQLLGGEITLDPKLTFENTNLMARPVPFNDARYLSGIVLSYQPKWVPGLFVGFTRAVQTYTDDNESPSVGIFEKYFPVLALAVEKKNVRNEDNMRRDQLASFFMRWVLPKAKTEFYIEYGYNDYGVNMRDYLLGPTHSAAYIAGIRKIIPMQQNRRLELGFELTQMSQTPDFMVRDAGNWYTHGQIWEGYTHQNQILGAGAGLGTNVQSITVNWVDGWKQLGFLIERLERDPQEHAVNKWIDFGIGVLPKWKYKNMIISAKAELVNSRRYMWEASLNRLNFHSRLSISYLF
ncbi:capsule assembly Wzi family protein [Sediminibacterium ginsengisoli]|uniref:Capsule assembly protein Wzi n=1 Tax=Sediminibacterium ginsengisoli TaxID=413434 RepID=A0A1T4N495_9BACT|nr:capsule assembly Wzi family protein [Sediminibacterium ginsengisoli]SJZ73964.1 Capsule assembly protein Wzi [Sediminibacterium ginsengisoli]